MKRLLSLFDESGIICIPFHNAWWDTIQWDIKLDEFMDLNNIQLAETALDLFEDINGIIAFPPCTDFAGAGAQYWKAKDADGRTKKSLHLVYQVQKLVNLFRPTDPEYEGSFFWAMENPVGRIAKLVPDLGKPFIFDPCDYAGYLHADDKVISERLDKIRKKKGIGVTSAEANFVLQFNAYTKRTCLYGEFEIPVKKRIEPVRCAPQGSPLQRLGGKSERTKELRSKTPEGFAEAFFQANKNRLWKPEYNDND